MIAPAVRLGLSLVLLVFVSFLIVIFMNPEVIRNLPELQISSIQTFKTMFVSIVLEAFPFILLGVVLSSILQVFVPDRIVQRLIPKNPVLGVLVSCLLGVIFPICECGMIPVARRLVKKGLPLYSAVVFLLAGPILNPVVFASTYMAFRARPEIVYSRMGLAFAVAAAVGLLVYAFVKKDPLKSVPSHAHHDHHHDHGHHHDRDSAGTGNKLFSTFEHASGEFIDMGKYLVFGALLTAGVQTFLDRDSLLAIANSEWISNWFMMGFAYILSICSTSDAFVASSFASTFSATSLIAFLVFGPMLDVKSTMMMLAVFRGRFVLFIAFFTFVAVSAGVFLLGKFI
ncbi:permease [Paenibacillus antri]|uniref:Permease n=1 Tax=Paenibacillus antri TaxID=2582848 RepID=A0A5R9GGD7_9BACL|nr:permease [Paenibacillus antri]TLS52364.1 permease [Paenibacillus antri]